MEPSRGWILHNLVSQGVTLSIWKIQVHQLLPQKTTPCSVWWCLSDTPQAPNCELQIRHNSWPRGTPLSTILEDIRNSPFLQQNPPVPVLKLRQANRELNLIDVRLSRPYHCRKKSGGRGSYHTYCAWYHHRHSAIHGGLQNLAIKYCGQQYRDKLPIPFHQVPGRPPQASTCFPSRRVLGGGKKMVNI